MGPHRYHKMSTSSLDTAIQSLPLELREKICKELISAKLKGAVRDGLGRRSTRRWSRLTQSENAWNVGSHV